MKTKIVSLLLALGLTTNAAFSGNSAKVGYASDFFYRGAQKAEQSVQSSVKLGSVLGGVDLSAHACTNQSVDAGVDSYNLGAGVGKSFSDGLLSVYAGVNHFEDRPGDALSEFQVGISSNVALNPSIAVYRDFDESLYTVELAVGHSFDLSVASLDLSASVGNTDLTNSTDRTYYTVGADISKSISENADLSVGVDYVDADDLNEREFVFGTALTVKF
jgi:hypothetical protein